jgi:endonuclease YncB( thermonuclease family)
VIAALIFLCDVAVVSDGDTFRCRDGRRIRLHAIDAPEIGRCRHGRICVRGDGQASRRALARMIGGRRLRCEDTGRSYDRVTAWCSLGAVDVSCAMVRGRWAVRLARYDRDQRLCR